MTLPISDFVDVNVSLIEGSADKFSFGTLLGIFDHSVSANRQDGPYSSVAEAVAAGFSSAAEPEVNAWVTAAFAQGNGVDQVLVGREDVGDADWTATMDAVEAAGPTSWYLTTAETRTEAEILLIAAWHEARNKIYIAQSSDAAILAGTAGNVALDLQTANYHRTALIYHATDTGADGYLDGAWASRCGGFNLDAPNGVGYWAYKQLSGVTTDDLSSAEATEVFDANANCYATLRGLNLTQKGTLASGRFLDVTSSLDWLQLRMEESILSAFASTPTKIPYTNAGIAQVVAAIESIYAQGIAYGHLSADEPPTLTIPKVTDVSAADKAARLLTLTGTAVLSGGIQKVQLNINVSQ